MVTKSFQFDGHRLVYDEYGKGAKVVVLLPGLLFSPKMHRPLAEELEERGHRVLCLDLLGHGDSDRPPEMWNYGMSIFGRQTIALLDHAGSTRPSSAAPRWAPTRRSRRRRRPGPREGDADRDAGARQRAARVRARVHAAARRADFGAPWRGLRRRRAGATGKLAARRHAARLGEPGPKPSASVLQGLFYGRVAPPREERAKMTQPTLVIGHYRDPIHPFSDSDMLVRELPNARIVQASSILELRLTPERLTAEIVGIRGRVLQADARVESPAPERIRGRSRQPLAAPVRLVAA